MNKKDLIDRASALTGLTKRDTEATVLAVIEAIIEAVSRGDRIDVSGHVSGHVSGLMIVKVIGKPARTGRNPITGASVDIPARRAVTIKPAAALKASANKE